MSDLSFKIEFGEEHEFSGANARWGHIELGGVVLFSELVYDTDKDGNRTEEQAEKNLLNLFGQRLRRVLEES